MNTSKKIILMILLLISCPIGIKAQTSYYYYKGKQIPLTLNESKVCVSIPKDKGDVSKEILKNIQVLDTIRDSYFDISIIQQSDFKQLSATTSWEKEAKSVMLSPCYRTKEGKEVFLTPYLNVRLKREQDISLLTSYSDRYGLRIVKQDSFMPLWYILSVSSNTGKNALDVANELWGSGYFAASAPDLSSNNLGYCCNDSLFYEQWGLNNNYNSGIDISACDAWGISTGKNVKIAIIDSGVDTTTIDLKGNISNLSFNAELSYGNSIVYSDHGTRCASIIAAKHNRRDIAGVAPDASIMSISKDLDNTTNFCHKMANGIRWAYENGADIISCSWGCPVENFEIDEAIMDAFSNGRNGKGCVIVFATGNDSINSISYPANCNDTILAVGSINMTGFRAKSNYGTGLDLVAPGDSILSIGQYNRLFKSNGTSWACPHVAGVAALVLERNPELTVTQVNRIICSNAKKLSNVTFNEIKPNGSWNEQYGYGLVDAYSSVINTPEIVYIQNDTITGTRIISADKIYVGKDVTDRKEQGEVILGQGNIILKANKVTIKNSTTVPLGTKLKIQNQ